MLECFQLETSGVINLAFSDGVLDFGRYPWVLESFQLEITGVGNLAFGDGVIVLGDTLECWSL